MNATLPHCTKAIGKPKGVTCLALQTVLTAVRLYFHFGFFLSSPQFYIPFMHRWTTRFMRSVSDASHRSCNALERCRCGRGCLNVCVCPFFVRCLIQNLLWLGRIEMKFASESMRFNTNSCECCNHG